MDLEDLPISELEVYVLIFSMLLKTIRFLFSLFLRLNFISMPIFKKKFLSMESCISGKREMFGSGILMKISKLGSSHLKVFLNILRKEECRIINIFLIRLMRIDIIQQNSILNILSMGSNYFS